MEWVPRLFALVILPAGSAVIGSFVMMVGFRNLRRARASLNWPTIEGTVVESKLNSSVDTESSSVSFFRAVTYRYTVQGVGHTSNVVSFRGERGLSEQLAEDALRPYRKGGVVKVYYDPDNPRVSALEVGHDWGNYVVIGVGILFAVIGIVLFVVLNFVLDIGEPAADNSWYRW